LVTNGFTERKNPDAGENHRERKITWYTTYWELANPPIVGSALGGDDVNILLRGDGLTNTEPISQYKTLPPSRGEKEEGRKGSDKTRAQGV